MIERIKMLCKEKGTNITNLCIEITGSRGNLSTWNKGNIRTDYLIKISKYFNVSTDYLLGLSDNTTLTGKEISKEQNELLSLFDKLNVTGKSKAIEYLTDLTEQSKYTDKKGYSSEASEELGIG